MIDDLIEMLKRKEREIDNLKYNKPIKISPRIRNRGNLTFGHGYDQQFAELPISKTGRKNITPRSTKQRNKN